MTKPTNKPAADPEIPRGGLRADAGRSWRNLNTGRLLLGSFERFEAEVLAALHAADYGTVRQTHFTLLRHLDAEGTRMSELAARASVTKAAITIIARSCEALGLVTIGVDPDDSRARLVRFSVEGEELMGFFRDTIVAMEQRLRVRLGSDAYDALRATLLDLSEVTGIVWFGSTRQARRRRMV